MTQVTREALVASIIAVIGQERFDVYGDDNLVTTHQMACLQAFRKNLSGESVEILRESYDQLERTGRYPFFCQDDKPSTGMAP